MTSLYENMFCELFCLYQKYSVTNQYKAAIKHLFPGVFSKLECTQCLLSYCARNYKIKYLFFNYKDDFKKSITVEQKLIELTTTYLQRYA